MSYAVPFSDTTEESGPSAEALLGSEVSDVPRITLVQGRLDVGSDSQGGRNQPPASKSTVSKKPAIPSNTAANNTAANTTVVNKVVGNKEGKTNKSQPVPITRGPAKRTLVPLEPESSKQAEIDSAKAALAELLGLKPQPQREAVWQDFANCLGVDPDLFFPERGASTKEAKEVCRGCVVKDECLEFALDNSEKFGIWGGMSERERRRIRRQRAIARRQVRSGEESASA